MTRPWKVTAVPPVGKTVVAEDHISTQIEIPPILPPAGQGRVLGDILRKRGFSDDEEGGTLTRDRNGVKVRINPQTGEMDVSAEESVDMPPPSNPSPCTCRARESLAEAASTRNDLQRKVTQRLEGAVSRLGCEIEGVIAQATKEMLKEKAGELGTIKEIREEEKGGITIVVEVPA